MVHTDSISGKAQSAIFLQLRFEGGKPVAFKQICSLRTSMRLINVVIETRFSCLNAVNAVTQEVDPAKDNLHWRRFLLAMVYLGLISRHNTLSCSSAHNSEAKIVALDQGCQIRGP